MQSPSKILVPVDFSESSKAALELATALGSRLGAAVDMLHVWPADHHAASKQELLHDFARSEPGHKMREWLAACEEGREVEAHARVAAGSRSEVPEAIVDAVTSGAYDLIVMATHGRQGLSLLWRNSIAGEVVKRAPCPVLMVRADDDDMPYPSGVAPDPLGIWTWPPR
jgi:nucleotide-binding universal stress UspA family protein